METAPARSLCLGNSQAPSLADVGSKLPTALPDPRPPTPGPGTRGWEST